jgi:hypothetical protein
VLVATLTRIVIVRCGGAFESRSTTTSVAGYVQLVPTTIAAAASNPSEPARFAMANESVSHAVFRGAQAAL